MLLSGSEIPEAVSGVIASIGSVGPGLAGVGAMDSYAFEPSMAKFIYSFDMFLGRVEIFPILVVLSLLFKRNR